jgi:hypothetical protein
MPNQVEIDHIVPVAQPSYFQPLSKDTASLNGMSVKIFDELPRP